jgi:hypothetical protein
LYNGDLYKHRGTVQEHYYMAQIPGEKKLLTLWAVIFIWKRDENVEMAIERRLGPYFKNLRYHRSYRVQRFVLVGPIFAM